LIFLLFRHFLKGFEKIYPFTLLQQKLLLFAPQIADISNFSDEKFQSLMNNSFDTIEYFNNFCYSIYYNSSTPIGLDHFLVYMLSTVPRRYHQCFNGSSECFLIPNHSSSDYLFRALLMNIQRIAIVHLENCEASLFQPVLHSLILGYMDLFDQMSQISINFSEHFSKLSHVRPNRILIARSINFCFV
jgi:hypothetical protein